MRWGAEVLKDFRKQTFMEDDDMFEKRKSRVEPDMQERMRAVMRKKRTAWIFPHSS